MATLIISAPKAKSVKEQKRSFEMTLNSGIGDAYAISKADAARLVHGSHVVLISKDEQRRAEGTLIRLEASGATNTGMKRYNVHIQNLEEVAYKPESLGRSGVSVV